MVLICQGCREPKVTHQTQIFSTPDNFTIYKALYKLSKYFHTPNYHMRINIHSLLDSFATRQPYFCLECSVEMKGKDRIGSTHTGCLIINIMNYIKRYLFLLCFLFVMCIPPSEFVLSFVHTSIG